MDYESALAWLYGTQAHGIKLGLENTRRLLHRFELFDRLRASSAEVFHVAGTNGKGSVCAFLESLLRHSGRRTGLFTSPHLIHFTERIRIEGIPVSQTVVAREISRFRQEVEDWDSHPTFFELTTAIALSCMLEAECDSLVLETGLGGRLDATNAVPSDVAILTSVDLDHEQHLGSSRTQIAGEKAGIIKPNRPVVLPGSLSGDAREVIEAVARERSSPLHVVEAPLDNSVPLGLRGRHQAWNAALALRARSLSEVPGDPGDFRVALAETTWPARFQSLERRGVRLVIDGAHNPAAIGSVVDTWREELQDQAATVVFGTVEGKQTGEMLRRLSLIAEEFVFTTTPTPRGLPAASLPSHCPATANQEVVPELDRALKHALSLGRPVLVVGSLFLAGKALEILEPPGGHPAFESSLQ